MNETTKKMLAELDACQRALNRRSGLKNRFYHDWYSLILARDCADRVR